MNIANTWGMYFRPHVSCNDTDNCHLPPRNRAAGT
jgi:hypothetical protein